MPSPDFHRDCSLLICGLAGAVSPIPTLKWTLDSLPACWPGVTIGVADYGLSRATIGLGDDAPDRQLRLIRYKPQCDKPSCSDIFREPP